MVTYWHKWWTANEEAIASAEKKRADHDEASNDRLDEFYTLLKSTRIQYLNRHGVKNLVKFENKHGKEETIRLFLDKIADGEYANCGGVEILKQELLASDLPKHVRFLLLSELLDELPLDECPEDNNNYTVSVPRSWNGLEKRVDAWCANFNYDKQLRCETSKGRQLNGIHGKLSKGARAKLKDKENREMDNFIALVEESMTGHPELSQFQEYRRTLAKSGEKFMWKTDGRKKTIVKALKEINRDQTPVSSEEEAKERVTDALGDQTVSTRVFDYLVDQINVKGVLPIEEDQLDMDSTQMQISLDAKCIELWDSLMPGSGSVPERDCFSFLDSEAADTVRELVGSMPSF